MRDVVREIQRAIDVPLMRDLGRESPSPIRGAIAEIPWRDMGSERLSWPDIPWRDDRGGRGCEQNRDFRVEQTDKTHADDRARRRPGRSSSATSSGPISVTAGSGKDVTIEIVRTSRGRTDADAKNGLQQVTVDVDHRGERATVNARYPRRGRQDFGVTVGYTVTAPPGTHVTVGGFSTDTTVKGIKGDVSVELVARNDRHLWRRTRLVSQDAFRHDLHQ